MRREDLFMDILGDLDEKYVALAMPRACGHSAAADIRTVTAVDPAEIGGEITKKDRVIYWVTRGLGMAAVAFLIIGAAVLLIMNWNKIAVREPDRPGEVTNVSEPVVTSDNTADNTSSDITDGNTCITEPDRPEVITSVSEPVVTSDSTADNTNGDITGGNTCIIDADLKYLIENSYAVVWAKCNNFLRSDDRCSVYDFTCMRTLAGKTISLESGLYVSDSHNEDFAINEGEYYVIPIMKKISVFYDTDRYYLASDIFFVTDDKGTILSTGADLRETEIGFVNVDELEQYINDNGLIPSQSDEDIGTKVTRTDDPEKAVQEAEYIVEAEVTGINTDFVEDRTSYDCRVLHKYKGADDIDEMIDVTMKKHSADVGEKYILLINRVSTGSLLFVISSPDTSVWRTDSPEAGKIREFCEQKYPFSDNFSDTTDRFGQITDTSMPEPFASPDNT